MTTSIIATPKEVERVLNLLRVVTTADQTATAIAHYLGPPITADIVRKLMKSRQFSRKAVADLILEAKRQGNLTQRNEGDRHASAS